MNQSRSVTNGLLEKFTYDLISNIFYIYLDQQDCLNCMATCHAWYELIPQFTQANWKTLQLDKKGISLRQGQNLGKHVKHVLFKGVSEYLLSDTMQQLLDYGCDEIESLGKVYIKPKKREREREIVKR